MSTPISPGATRGVPLRWILRIGGLAALLAGVWFLGELRRSAPPPPPEVGSAATLLPVAKPLPDFSLVDQEGASFGRERLEGRWSFLFFGYTHCPSICPMTLGAMRDLRRDLVSGDPALDAQFMFVSVDPERDDPEALLRYVRHFDATFTGATGEPAEIDRLTREIGVFHERAAGGTEAEYDFDHTASLLLVDPDARLHAVFSPPIEPDAAADAFRAIRALADRASEKAS